MSFISGASGLTVREARYYLLRWVRRSDGPLHV